MIFSIELKVTLQGLLTGTITLSIVIAVTSSRSLARECQICLFVEYIFHTMQICYSTLKHV